MNSRTHIGRWIWKPGIGATLVCFGIAACSSSQSTPDGDAGGTKCGPGTTLVNGVCVIADGGSADADGNAPDALADDPCPTLSTNPNAIDFVNCSDTCGAGRRDGPCLWGCEPFQAPLQIGKTDDFPFYIRTPRDLSHFTACNTQCPAGSASASYGLILDFTAFSTSGSSRTRVRVEPPFYLAREGAPGGGGNRLCYFPPAATYCLELASTGGVVEVLTLPGTMVSRSQNIIIDDAPAGQPVCP